ncbi:hypothetical protein AB1E18_014826 [Capra hircus]
MLRFAPLTAGAAAGVEQKLPVNTRVWEASTLRPTEARTDQSTSGQLSASPRHCTDTLEYSAKRMESGATNEFHVVPPFLNVPPVCLEPWLQVADAAEPLKRKV